MNDAFDDLREPQDEFDRCVDRVIREYFDSEVQPLTADPDAALVGPAAAPSGESFVLPRCVGRYPITALIGRGGLGWVLRGLDPELGREIAVKIVQPRHREDREIVASFLEEARVTSQLQHPGIVPIHEVGRTADGLPYFTMKVVEGESLALLLRRRRFPQEDRLRFLQVFAQVCQTVAFAHHAGIVHRDLKPGNVMVGRFGEVQVVDWGFACSLRRDGGEAAAGTARPAARSRVLGTPAYMAPEQARGHLDAIDARADVFALGAILTEILTGAPPYLAETREEVFLMASKGWQQDARERLAICGADEAFVALAERCLAPDKAARPADAASVADEIERHLSDLERRNRELLVQAAEARANARQERRRRRSMLATAIAVGIALIAALGYLWREAESDRVLHAAISRAKVFVEQARDGDSQDAAAWQAARAAVEQAATFAGRDAPAVPEVSELLRQVDDGEASSRRDRAFLEWFSGPRLQLAYDLMVDSGGLDAGYTEAFAAWGVDVVALDVEQAAARIRAGRIADRMVHGLDRMVEFSRASGDGSAPRRELSRKLTEIAMAADDEPWRNRVRQAFLADDLATLQALSRDAGLERQTLASLDLLASALRVNGDLHGAVRVLRVAAQREPGEYQVVHSLERVLHQIGATPREILWLSLRGVSLRPDSAHAWHHLADAFQANGDLELAQQAYRRMAESGPDYPLAATVLTMQRGRQLLAQGRVGAAERLFRRLAEQEPGNDNALAFHGLALMTLHDTDAAVASVRAALAIRETAERRCNLGMLLRLQGRFEESLEQLSRGHELSRQRVEWRYPSGEWLELVADLQARAAVIAAGDLESLPEIPEERARFALTALLTGQPRLAWQLFGEAFARSGQSAEGIAGPEHFDASFREFAAIAAIEAAGRMERASPDAAVDLRTQALQEARAWLTEELAWLEARAREQTSATELREHVSRMLLGPVLAPVRREEGLRALEQDAAQIEAWQALWARAERDLEQTSEGR